MHYFTSQFGGASKLPNNQKCSVVWLTWGPWKCKIAIRISSNLKLTLWYFTWFGTVHPLFTSEQYKDMQRAYVLAEFSLMEAHSASSSSIFSRRVGTWLQIRRTEPVLPAAPQRLQAVFSDCQPTLALRRDHAPDLCCWFEADGV